MSYITTKFKKYTFKGLECNGISINGNGITDQFTNGNQLIITEINSKIITQPVEIQTKLKLEITQNSVQNGLCFICLKNYASTLLTSPYALFINRDSKGYYTQFFVRRGYGTINTYLETYFENDLDWLNIIFKNNGSECSIEIWNCDKTKLLASKTETIPWTPVWDNYHTNLWIYFNGVEYGNAKVPKFVQYDLSESYIKDLTTGKVLSDWNK